MWSHLLSRALVLVPAATAVALLGGGRPAPPRAPTLLGDWAGIIELGGHSAAVTAHFAAGDAGRITGSTDLFGEATSADLHALRAVRDSVTARFDLRLYGTTEIRARLEGDTLRGVAKRGALTGAVRLLRLAPPDTAAMHADEGIYVADADTFLVNLVAPTMLTVSELPSHRLRILYPVGPNEFIAGPTLFAALPAQWRLHFRERGAGGASFTLTRAGRVTEPRRLPLHVEEVRFRNGNVTLAGEFIRPEAPGRYPVVVHMHGSGPNTRRSVQGMVYLLAAHGIAGLVYDKRGSGGSSADEMTEMMATMDDLGGDAVAGADYLMTRPDVDTLHVGFTGISEGATTSEVAASRFRRTAFVIPMSGGALPANVWEEYESEDQLRTDGHFSGGERKDAMEFLRLRDAYARTRANWAEYEAALRRALAPNGPRWYGYATTDLFGWSKPDSRGWEMKTISYFYDPYPVLHSLRCPVLLLYGQHDVPRAIPVEVRRAREALAGNRDATIDVLPGANHNFFLTRSGNAHEVDDVTSFAPGLFPLITRWLEERVRPSAAAASGRQGRASAL